VSDSRITYHKIPETDAYEVRQDGELLGTAYLCTKRLWCARSIDGQRTEGPWMTRHEAGLWCESDQVNAMNVRILQARRQAEGKTLGQRLQRFRAHKIASSGEYVLTEQGENDERS
jgi:hypothetical protein